MYWWELCCCTIKSLHPTLLRFVTVEINNASYQWWLNGANNCHPAHSAHIPHFAPPSATATRLQLSVAKSSQVGTFIDGLTWWTAAAGLTQSSSVIVYLGVRCCTVLLFYVYSTYIMLLSVTCISPCCLVTCALLLIIDYSWLVAVIIVWLLLSKKVTQLYYLWLTAL